MSQLCRRMRFHNGVHNIIYFNLAVATTCFLVDNAIHLVNGFVNAEYTAKYCLAPVVNLISYTIYVFLSYFLHEAAFTNNAKMCLTWIVIKVFSVLTWFMAMIIYLEGLEPSSSLDNYKGSLFWKYFLLFICFVAELYQLTVTMVFVGYVRRMKTIKRLELINNDMWDGEKMLVLHA